MKTSPALNQKDKNDKNFILIILAFLAIYIIWGSTYLFNKIAVKENYSLKKPLIVYQTTTDNLKYKNMLSYIIPFLVLI